MVQKPVWRQIRGRLTKLAFSPIIRKNMEMKSKYINKWMLPVVASGLMLTGCVVEPDGRVYVRPAVVVAAPPPVVVAPEPVVVAPEPAVVLVPDSYVWDGVEFVGFVGGGYVYLGPGNVWIGCDEVRLGRFHDYERIHPDWRMHATVNVNFRRDRFGHEAPRRDGGDRREPQRQERRPEEKRDNRDERH